MGEMRLMKDKLTIARVVIIAMLLYGCATSPAAKIDHDPTQDFSTYQSFTWFSENPMKVGETANPPSDSLQREIMDAIQLRLEANSYRLADGPKPADFLVSFTVGSRESTISDSDADSDSEAPPTVRGRGGWGTASRGGASESYTRGILVINIFDAAERRLVWHGASSKKITEEDRENMLQVIDAVVDTILSNFLRTNSHNKGVIE